MNHAAPLIHRMLAYVGLSLVILLVWTTLWPSPKRSTFAAPPAKAPVVAKPSTPPLTLAEFKRLELRIMQIETNALRREDLVRLAANNAFIATQRLQGVEEQIAYVRASQELIRQGIDDIQATLREHIIRSNLALPIPQRAPDPPNH